MASVSKSEYLKRYISEDCDKKKKKKKIKKGPRPRIFDDDVDLKSLMPDNAGNNLDDDLQENLPTVADYIDERPVLVQQLEQFQDANRWKMVANKVEDGEIISDKSDGEIEDDSHHASPKSDLSSTDSGMSLKKKQSTDRKKRYHSSNTDKDGRSLKDDLKNRSLDSSDSSDGQDDSGPERSPSRRLRHNLASDKSPTHGSASDSDQHSKHKRRSLNQSDSDQSMPRHGRHDSDSEDTLPRQSRHLSDSDHSLPRRGRHKSDSDNSLPRRGRHDSDSDQSVSRQNKLESDSDLSSSDSDQPVPRRRQYSGSRYRHLANSSHTSPKRQVDSDNSSHRKKKVMDSDSDLSPVRSSHRGSTTSPQRKRRSRPGQMSPSRYNHSSAYPKDRHATQRSHDNDDSDLSPPRHGHRHSSSASPRSADGKGRPQRTLGGTRAGLSSAAETRKEIRHMRQRENKLFQQMDTSVSGKNAETVIRDRSTGRRRDMKQELAKKEEEQKKKAEKDAKYAEWGKGLKQKAQQQQAVQDSVYEMSKPLARYKDDKDLDQMLREKIRPDDPMLAFIKKKKKPDKNVKEKPMYKGPPAPPNRYNIQPGYRWDGVDRSNGYETQLYAKIAEKKATAQMAYKWSVEEM
ncbi:Hypothetical predicted protein [Octopus vulgaris]|nr:Hypothetical predicted protein [Octopus vulgaris]